MTEVSRSRDAERVWQAMTLTKVGRLGDLMQGGGATHSDGGGNKETR